MNVGRIHQADRQIQTTGLHLHFLLKNNRHQVVPRVGETDMKVAVATQGTAEKVQLFTRL